MAQKVLQTQVNRGKMLTVRDGWLQCPICCRNNRMLRIFPDTKATGLQVHCRLCKAEIIVNIDKGECHEGHGQ